MRALDRTAPASLASFSVAPISCDAPRTPALTLRTADFGRQWGRMPVFERGKTPRHALSDPCGASAARPNRPFGTRSASSGRRRYGVWAGYSISRDRHVPSRTLALSNPAGRAVGVAVARAVGAVRQAPERPPLGAWRA